MKLIKTMKPIKNFTKISVENFENKTKNNNNFIKLL